MGCDINDKQAVKHYQELIRTRLNIQVVGFQFLKDMPNNKNIFYSALDGLIKINENYIKLVDEYLIMHELFYALITTADNDKKRLRFGIYIINEEGEMTPESIKSRSAHRGLNMGFTKMITDMMMNAKETANGAYPGLTKIARQIRDMFGMDIIFKAMFEGPEVLEEVFDIAGGKGKFHELSKIADEMLAIDESK